MRRPALRSLRLPSRPVLRKLLRNQTPYFNLSHALGLRTLYLRHERVTLSNLQSAMQLGKLSVALVSTLVASGAYYSYKGASDRADSSSNYTTTTPTTSRPTTFGPEKAESPTETTRRALIVDRGQLYTGSIVGNEPLSKETDDRGRKVLEIMTPEQVDERLRRNEESWEVGRGNGVLRYDLVQIPSNDPIEDDHVEQTIEIPSGQDGSSKADWMFWGVFDGHRYVKFWYTISSLKNFQWLDYICQTAASTCHTCCPGS